MANLTKEQLLEKDYAELQALAEQMNILNYMDKSQDDLIYSILAIPFFQIHFVLLLFG